MPPNEKKLNRLAFRAESSWAEIRTILRGIRKEVKRRDLSLQGRTGAEAQQLISDIEARSEAAWRKEVSDLQEWANTTEDRHLINSRVQRLGPTKAIVLGMRGRFEEDFRVKWRPHFRRYLMGREPLPEAIFDGEPGSGIEEHGPTTLGSEQRTQPNGSAQGLDADQIDDEDEAVDSEG